MALTNEQKETLFQGFLQIGFSLLLYLVFSIVGFITTILIGFILPEYISAYIQGFTIVLTQCLGGYFSIKALQTDSSNGNIE